MQFQDADIEKLAMLSRIKLSEKEEKELLSDMGSILDYVKQIEDIRVEDLEPEYKNYNIWREDKMEPRDFSRELILEQFPDSQDGFLKVKKIL